MYSNLPGWKVQVVAVGRKAEVRFREEREIAQQGVIELQAYFAPHISDIFLSVPGFSQTGIQQQRGVEATAGGVALEIVCQIENIAQQQFPCSDGGRRRTVWETRLVIEQAHSVEPGDVVLQKGSVGGSFVQQRFSAACVLCLFAAIQEATAHNTQGQMIQPLAVLVFKVVTLFHVALLQAVGEGVEARCLQGSVCGSVMLYGVLAFLS